MSEWVCVNETHLQSFLCLVEGKGLPGKLSELEVSVVWHAPSVGPHHLLIVVPSLRKEVGLVLGDGPKVKLRPRHFLQLLDDVVQGWEGGREGEETRNSDREGNMSREIKSDFSPFCAPSTSCSFLLTFALYSSSSPSPSILAPPPLPVAGGDALGTTSTDTLSPLVSSTGWVGSSDGRSSLGGNPHRNLCCSAGMLEERERERYFEVETILKSQTLLY